MSATRFLPGPVRVFMPAIAALALNSAPMALGHGEAGEHVEALQEHLPEYAESVEIFLDEVDGVVSSYESGGASEADAERPVEAWEEAKIHAAIELNYVALYAEIWQGIYAIKEGIEAEKPVAEIRETQAGLTKTLWQSLGAVKMAAKVQEEGHHEGEDEGAGGVEIAGNAAALKEIRARLDRVVGKCAERDFATAEEMLHDTYLHLFEGVEGELIEQDAALVAGLEKDFKVTLAQEIEKEAPLEDIKETVAAMKTKLEHAGTLLAEAEEDESDAF